MIEQEDQEAEVLLLNRQMLTEVKELIDYIKGQTDGQGGLSG